MRRNIREGFTPEGTPDMKYYAFDWDDNIVHMPTKIILKGKNGDVHMGTLEFAKYREIIGKKPFKYKGDIVVGYADNPFRNFRVDADKDFITDAMTAKPGPAFDDFKEAINNGSIFSIITARGHSPETLKEGVYNYIVSNFNGIDKDELIKNLKKYRTFMDEDDMSDKELIDSYLELNRYHPVAFGVSDEESSKPEKLKVAVFKDFVEYVKSLASLLGKKAYVKNNIRNKFVPLIGFSDDDRKNAETMRKDIDDKDIKIFYTGSGTKEEL